MGMNLDAYLVLGATIAVENDHNYELLNLLDEEKIFENDGLFAFLEEFVYDLSTELGFEVTYSITGNTEYSEEFVIHGLHYHNADWYSKQVTYPYFTEQDYIQHSALIQALKKKGFELEIAGVILFPVFSH